MKLTILIAILGTTGIAQARDMFTPPRPRGAIEAEEAAKARDAAVLRELEERSKQPIQEKPASVKESPKAQVQQPVRTPASEPEGKYLCSKNQYADTRRDGVALFEEVTKVRGLMRAKNHLLEDLPHTGMTRSTVSVMEKRELTLKISGLMTVELPAKVCQENGKLVIIVNATSFGYGHLKVDVEPKGPGQVLMVGAGNARKLLNNTYSFATK